MSHLGWLITAADSLFLVSVICISWHSVRIDLTMTNSHFTIKNTIACIMVLTESLDRWMKNQSLVMFVVLSLLHPPPLSISLSSLIECMFSMV